MARQKVGLVKNIPKVENNFGNANIVDLTSQPVTNVEKYRPRTAFVPRSKSQYN